MSYGLQIIIFLLTHFLLFTGNCSNLYNMLTVKPIRYCETRSIFDLD